MKALYEGIIAKLQTIEMPPDWTLPNPYVSVWNNQVESLRARQSMRIEDSIEKLEDFTRGNARQEIPLPAILIEMDNLETELLGNGVEIYPDLKVRLHLLHYQEDSGDGMHDQNLDVMIFEQKVYQCMQKAIFPGTNEFIREREERDHDHDNLYHYIVEYGTTYIDATMQEPVGGQTQSGIGVKFSKSKGQDGILSDESGNIIEGGTPAIDISL